MRTPTNKKMANWFMDPTPLRDDASAQFAPLTRSQVCARGCWKLACRYLNIAVISAIVGSVGFGTACGMAAAVWKLTKPDIDLDITVSNLG